MEWFEALALLLGSIMLLMARVAESITKNRTDAVSLASASAASSDESQ